MRLQLEAFIELCKRYGQHFRYAWSRRAAMNPLSRSAHEVEFLPAALSLQERPVHPAPRVAMYLILGFALLALLWSIFGKVDIVATASGKIIPNDRTKVIQPLETAIVKAIHVRDGQSVHTGDVLVELDATTAQADTDRTRSDWQQAQLDGARAHALLVALHENKANARMADPLRGADTEKYAAAQRFLDGEYSEYRSKLEQLNAELGQNLAERNETLENLHKLQETLPIARKREDDLKELLDKNYISHHDYLDKKQARIEMERDLAASKARLTKVDAVILTTKRQRAALTAETQRSQLDQEHEAEQKMEEYRQEYIKANDRRNSMTLTAPVDGTVQQLAVHTIGGVVTPAQQLMAIVPRDKKLEVEALVKNKDIGFVNAGQNAEVKVETFPYTKYGTIHAKVLHVSNDAIQQGISRQGQKSDMDTIFSSHDNERPEGLVYSAIVRLEKSTMQVDGKTINLSPGMAVTVEIKTGKRRLIEYFLSPLLQYREESLRER